MKVPAQPLRLLIGHSLQQGYSVENIERQEAADGEPAQMWIALEPIKGKTMTCSGCGVDLLTLHDVSDRWIRELPVLVLVVGQEKKRRLSRMWTQARRVVLVAKFAREVIDRVRVDEANRLPLHTSVLEGINNKIKLSNHDIRIQR